ncbi:unnamed protein product [Gongylonema pulchrum]|uniref:C2H2-type domain-containing protein n=1 Tax=Gongylonema pulchrum TaxID=637853 RepID=A0A183EDA1_9BILA|nr:unnamed protein product [Gongylonema pulchrum]
MVPSLLEQLQLANTPQDDAFRMLSGMFGGNEGATPGAAVPSASNVLLQSAFTANVSPSKDTYCEKCDKNFCNRYFLRTHKWKKHGIPMAEKNPPTLGLMPSPQCYVLQDTYCEKCDKNFCNRYFLRTHKWKKHGIPMAEKNPPPLGLMPSPTNPLDMPSTSAGINFNPSELLAAMCGQQAPQISPSKTSGSQPTSVIVNRPSGGASSPPTKQPRLDDRSKCDSGETSAALRLALRK